MAMPKPSGQLGDPNMTVGTDPRANIPMVERLKAIGAGGKNPPVPLDRNCSEAELLEYLGQSNDAFGNVVNYIPLDLPEDQHVKATREEQIIKGGDAQDMNIFITRPAQKNTVMPCVIYIHGGGMVIIETDNALCHAWCRDIANAGSGAVVVMPNFRNAYDSKQKKLVPFPAGLNDCVACVEWVAAHKEELGIGKIIVTGESGGANLSLATALKLKQDGKIDILDGVYACCPYISGLYKAPRERLAAELPSLLEFDGYFLSTPNMDILVKAYDPESKNAENPLAWPYFATEDDVKGLPPHRITVDELDPLKDEGMAYVRKLDKAGVSVVGKVTLGTIHSGAMMLRADLKDIRFAMVDDMNAFANRV